MNDKSEENVIVENTTRPPLRRKYIEAELEDRATFVETFLGCIFLAVVLIISIFSSVLIQMFEVVPTNLVMVKSVIQLIVFIISNKANSISFIPDDSRDVPVLTLQSLLSGLAFIFSIGAVRLLPLGDFFTIIFSKTVFFMLLMSCFGGRAVTKKKMTLAMITMLGFVLLISNWYNCHQNDGMEMINPQDDSNIWLGLGMAIMYNACSSQVEVLRLATKSAAGVLSFWSAVGGLVTAALSSFFSSEASLLSGAMPTAIQIFLLLFLSISAIATLLILSQAEKLVSKTFVISVRSLEIPIGLLLSLGLASGYLPSYVGYVGVFFIVTSSVVAQATMEDEDSTESSTDIYENV